MPRNLLILYLSCGAGHKQAAHALHEAAVDRGDWERIDRDIAKAVRNAYDGNGKQHDSGRSDDELEKTILTWGRQGFRLSDKQETDWMRSAQLQSCGQI